MPATLVKSASSNDYQLEFSKRVFDPQWGYSWVYRYRGENTAIQNLGDSFIANGWRVETTQDGTGNTTLELYISDPSEILQPGTVNEVTEQWTWESEFYTRDSYSNPLIHSDPVTTAPNPGSVTLAQIVIIEAALKHYRAGETDDYNTERAKLDSGGASENSLALALLDQKTRGVEYDEVDIPSLIRQRTYHINYASRRQVEMIENFYSTIRLIANEGIPIIIQNTMPVNPSQKPPNAQWGWKERASTLELIPQVGKAIETTRWSFNAWSTLTYNYIA